MAGEKIFRSTGDPLIIYLTKPLLMPILAVWLIAGNALKKPFHRIIILGLMFSMGGDIFLMFKSEDMFIFGLGSFLIAHIFYIVAFARNVSVSPIRVSAGHKIAISVPFIAFVMVFLMLLKGYMLGNEKTEPLFPPVVVYASVIGCMGALAAWRFRATSAASFRLVLAGALLFILSDSTIAVNKFISPVPQASLIVMGTYIAAQYLIVKGTLCHSITRPS